MREGEPSLTSTLVALARAFAPKHRDRFAEQLAGDPWRSVAAAGESPIARALVRALSVGVVDHLALRTATLDTFVRDAVAAGCEQIVILGAGLDARAWRLGVDARFFEVDHPSTQRVKASRAPAGGGTFVPVDFTRDDLDQALAAAGHDPERPSAWVWEGVTMYLPPRAVAATLGVVERRSAPGSRLALTYLDPTAVPLSPVVRVAFRAVFGEPLDAGFTPEAMRALLHAHGFEAHFDGSSRTWDRTLGGDPRAAALVRAERLVIAHRV